MAVLHLPVQFFGTVRRIGGSYTNGSTYESNLKQIVASLASNASQSGSFYSDTVGAGTPDQINGKIMCYADANRTDCLDCLKTAAYEVTNLLICQNAKTAATHYNACFLHYSNISFLTILQGFYPYCLQTPDEKMPGKDFLSNSSVQSLISSLTADASNLDQKYATNKTNYMAGQTVQGLVQCTRDLKLASALNAYIPLMLPRTQCPLLFHQIYLLQYHPFHRLYLHLPFMVQKVRNQRLFSYT